ncbi:Transposase InsN for insertion sequence element IS911A [Pseudomonas synxantha]|nr:Transposase InsN for insertion sequence element IS911A [Pseudomonas synxantha]
MRKSYSSEFKLNAVSMVLDQNLSVPEICTSLDIGPTALRRWVEQVRKERTGSTMAGTKAITADQKKIQELQALLRQKDRDIEILKRPVFSCFWTPKIIPSDQRARRTVRHYRLLPRF